MYADARIALAFGSLEAGRAGFGSAGPEGPCPTDVAQAAEEAYRQGKTSIATGLLDLLYLAFDCAASLVPSSPPLDSELTELLAAVAASR